jgi:hypothetical protein
MGSRARQIAELVCHFEGAGWFLCPLVLEPARLASAYGGEQFEGRKVLGALSVSRSTTGISCLLHAVGGGAMHAPAYVAASHNKRPR